MDATTMGIDSGEKNILRKHLIPIIISLQL